MVLLISWAVICLVTSFIVGFEEDMDKRWGLVDFIVTGIEVAVRMFFIAPLIIIRDLWNGWK